MVMLLKVLDSGSIQELDHPLTLLQNDSSALNKMVHQLGPAEAAAVLHAARQVQELTHELNVNILYFHTYKEKALPPQQSDKYYLSLNTKLHVFTSHPVLSTQVQRQTLKTSSSEKPATANIREQSQRQPRYCPCSPQLPHSSWDGVYFCKPADSHSKNMSLKCKHFPPSLNVL